MWHLKHKIALVTGGTKGIGKAIIQEFVDLGATVIFTARNEEEVKKVASDFKSKGYPVFGRKADVSVLEDRKELLEFIQKRFNRLDVLVNNAGINIRKNAVDYTEEEYRKVMDINLLAPFELSREAFLLLTKSKAAAIVNIASTAASFDVRSGTPYAMAKSGLLQQSRSLAVEWAEKNIRVNSVSPWYTETPLTEAVLSKTERLALIKERTPLHRVAQPEEIAAAVAFLAMEKSSYITGQNLNVDGGISVSAL
ncbi:SDR family oxidoreductase [Ascidiimonas sp. W6]|uniref:SDR family oxidoreductase n=1 Tax=Ascidiimonas meishanensis TaxID=3128903 RepID=UPI0030EBB84F